jgi:hypothetical protein
VGKDGRLGHGDNSDRYAARAPSAMSRFSLLKPRFLTYWHWTRDSGRRPRRCKPCTASRWPTYPAGTSPCLLLVFFVLLRFSFFFFLWLNLKPSRYYHSAAVTDEGRVYTWGWGEHGQVPPHHVASDDGDDLSTSRF